MNSNISSSKFKGKKSYDFVRGIHEANVSLDYPDTGESPVRQKIVLLNGTSKREYVLIIIEVVTLNVIAIADAIHLSMP